MIRRFACLALGLLAAAVTPVAAQDAYPTRPITIVVPFPPGGVADLTARPVAAAMEKVLKSPVAVVNKQGAAGAVGMQSVAVAKPDGYTLLLALSSISIIPEADRLFNRPPAFTVDQFAPIALISADPTVLVVPADKPWKTAKEFIEDAKKRPGQISYSSSGIYGTLHMAMELLSQAADIKLRHVPHSGGGPALTAVLGGHVDALASDKRIAALPDVPTFKELGYPDAEFYIWAGLFAPKGTPEAVLAKLRATVREAVNDPEFKGAMDKLETPVTFKQGEEFQRFFDADARRLAEGVRRVGRVEAK
jgi:tripartite-type tricarboxylate transporter receptor subunit TctC